MKLNNHYKFKLLKFRAVSWQLAGLIIQAIMLPFVNFNLGWLSFTVGILVVIFLMWQTVNTIMMKWDDKE